MKARYVGNFPPPYGGVTIKNQLLYETLSEKMKLARYGKASFMPASLYQMLNMLKALVSREPLIIGISAMGGKSRLMTKLLYIFNRGTMKKSLYFMMGGTEAGRIANSPEEIGWYSEYRAVYVETRSMVKQLTDAGMRNVKYYPNCRKRPGFEVKIRNHSACRLRCVFFSLIQKMKGVDTILEAAGQLPEVDFVFYGHIDPEYEAEFGQAAASLPNVRYLGVFQGSNDAVYAELSQYDILLLPTRWKTEGVPGVLVEAKIAAVPAIVSDACYNAEIVEDGVSGIVLRENSARELVTVIAGLNSERNRLNTLKKGALCSADGYYIETYIQDIVNRMR